MNDKKINIYRLQYNQQTGQWIKVPVQGFQQLDPESLAELYRHAKNRLEETRQEVVEQALEYSDFSEAKSVLDKVMKK